MTDLAFSSLDVTRKRKPLLEKDFHKLALMCLSLSFCSQFVLKQGQ